MFGWTCLEAVAASSVSAGESCDVISHSGSLILQFKIERSIMPD